MRDENITFLFNVLLPIPLTLYSSPILLLSPISGAVFSDYIFMGVILIKVILIIYCDYISLLRQPFGFLGANNYLMQVVGAFSFYLLLID